MSKSDVDLLGRLRLAWQFMGNALDERRNLRPYFSWALADSPAYALHTHYDTPHVVGRFLDALLPAERLVGEQANPDVVCGLTHLLYQSISAEDGLGWSDAGPTGRSEALVHDQREVLLALADLIEFRDSDDARTAARQFCRQVRRLIGEGDVFPSHALSRSGWHAGSGAAFSYAPANSGRLVHALVRFYRLSGDANALDLARRFTDDNRARCFTPDGRLTPLAGVHVHSITGTVEGILEFGLLSGECDYVEHARRIYEVGLRPYRSTFGWVKENLGNASFDGEANNTGDILRIAILLARNGYPGYFEDAERTLRNHLLASQLLDGSWIEEGVEPETAERSFREIGRRAVGGFGFTTPNDWMVDLNPKRRVKMFPLNADLVQGAVQAILAAWDSALVEDALGTRVNLLLSREGQRVTVESEMSSVGRIRVSVKRPTNLFVRRPSWVADREVAISVDGQRQAPLPSGEYLFVPGLAAGASVVVSFRPNRVVRPEHINHRLFQVVWWGDQVLDVSPIGSHRPLYTGERT